MQAKGVASAFSGKPGSAVSIETRREGEGAGGFEQGRNLVSMLTRGSYSQRQGAMYHKLKTGNLETRRKYPYSMGGIIIECGEWVLQKNSG